MSSCWCSSPKPASAGSRSMSRCSSPTSCPTVRNWQSGCTAVWARSLTAQPSWSPAISVSWAPRCPRWRVPRLRRLLLIWSTGLPPLWHRCRNWPVRPWWPASSMAATSGAPTCSRRWARLPRCWEVRSRWLYPRPAQHCMCLTRWSRRPSSTTSCAAGWPSPTRRSRKSSCWRVLWMRGATRWPPRSRRPTRLPSPAGRTRV
ncbi:Uncharacterised protein [Mycobacteroides abscessus subsp. abscessus]|nr:Uncharacterised protein [Mycobacteroides abscessus subsp. abscessus]